MPARPMGPARGTSGTGRLAVVDILKMLRYNVRHTVGLAYDQVQHARQHEHDKVHTTTTEESRLDIPYILGTGALLHPRPPPYPLQVQRV